MKTHKTMLKNQSVFSYPWVARMFWIRPCRFSLHPANVKFVSHRMQRSSINQLFTGSSTLSPTPKSDKNGGIYYSYFIMVTLTSGGI